MDRSTPYYPTDLTDAQWERIRLFIPASRPIGADRTTPMRDVVNAILYRTRCGCPWRMLPRDFPHWRTIYGYFDQWRQDGTWDAIRRCLKSPRRRTGKHRNAA
jgi:putative transposase